MPWMDSHALVTGGAKGIGAAIADALQSQGVQVSVLGRDEAALANFTREGRAAGYVVADVTDPAQLSDAIHSAEDARGPISILINNAGAVESGAFVKTKRLVWDYMLAVNLTSVFETCQIVLPGMVKRKYGRIVNIASTAGLKGYPYVAAYCAGEHGVNGLTRGLALGSAHLDVTVNAICPGYTDTDLVTRSISTIVQKSGRSENDVRHEISKSNPQNRLITPEEVAAAVLYLCGPNSRAMIGQSLVIGGGEIM